MRPQTGARGSMYCLALTSPLLLAARLSPGSPVKLSRLKRPPYLFAGLLMSALGRVLNSSLLRTTPMTL